MPRGIYGVWNKNFVIWGCQDMVALPHVPSYNNVPAFSFKFWGCSIIPTQNIGDHENLGVRD